MKKIVIAILLVTVTLCMFACDGGDTDGDTYTFRHNNTTVAIGDRADDAVAALGAYRDLEQSGSCGFDQQDRTYDYGGFELFAAYEDGAHRVHTISLYDDTVATPEGIRIGSSRDDVIEIYGEADEKDSGNLLYKGEGMTLTIFFEGDTVSEIVYIKK